WACWRIAAKRSGGPARNREGISLGLRPTPKALPTLHPPIDGLTRNRRVGVTNRQPSVVTRSRVSENKEFVCDVSHGLGCALTAALAWRCPCLSAGLCR